MATPPDRRDALRALRAAGLSQVAAAASVGVSRRTVQRLEFLDRLTPPVEVAPTLDPPYEGKAVRCDQCGRLVVPPCRACSTPPAIGLPGDFTDPELRLALRPADHARYLRIQRERAADAVFGRLADGLPEDWLLGDDLPEPSDDVLADIARRRGSV